MEKPKLVKKPSKPADPPKPTAAPKVKTVAKAPAVVESPPVASAPMPNPAEAVEPPPPETGGTPRTSLSPAEIQAIKSLCMPLWLKGWSLNGIQFEELCARYSIDKADLNRILDDLLTRVQLPRDMTFRIEKAYYLGASDWTGDKGGFITHLGNTLKLHRRIIQTWIYQAGFIPRHIREQCKAEGFDATPERLAAVGEAYLETLRADQPTEIGLHPYLAAKLGVTRRQAHLLLFQWRGEFTKNRFPPVRHQAKPRADESETSSDAGAPDSKPDACGSPTDDTTA